ncbi:tetratricopeptide repeat protein, partial [bacterium]
MIGNPVFSLFILHLCTKFPHLCSSVANVTCCSAPFLLTSFRIFLYLESYSKRERVMGILDFGSFDDEPEDDQRKKEHFEEELKKYQDMLKNGGSNITSIEALEEIVGFYFDNEKYAEALHFVTQLLAIMPYSAENWQRKGLILSNLFKYDEALECYDRALSLNPVDPELLINKGITLDDLGQTEEALACFDRALEIDPSNDEALFNKGITLEKAGRYEDAIQIFR